MMNIESSNSRKRIKIKKKLIPDERIQPKGELDYSTFYWMFEPIMNHYSNMNLETYTNVPKKRSSCFNDFQKCKADGLNEVNNGDYFEQVHLLVYESIYRLNGDIDTFPVFSTIIQPYKYDVNVRVFNHYPVY